MSAGNFKSFYGSRVQPDSIGFLRKEVIQPLVPQRLPCYDFTPIISHTLGAYPPARGWSNDFWYNQLSWCDGRCVQGPGTYSPWHADPRLLAIPTSCPRVAEDNPNWDDFSGLAPACAIAAHCCRHCSTCVAQPVRAMRT